MKIGIVGAGASGIVAAIEASEAGAEVTLFERKDRVGKKILATGNGRCNFTNSNMSGEYYYVSDPLFVDDIYQRFGHNDLVMYFYKLGLLSKEKNGYFYPACEQASAVLDTLRAALEERNVNLLCDSFVTDIEITKKGKYKVCLENGNSFSFDKLIVSTGGKAGIGKKEIANGYDLLKRLGHKITPLYPSLTQIKCEGDYFKAISGVRSDCILYAFEGDELMMQQQGEVLFTEYGISGIVSFQVSHFVAKSINEGKNVSIVFDLLPGVDENALENFVVSKKLLHDSMTLEQFLTGIQNKKLNMVIMKQNGFRPDMKIRNIDDSDLVRLVLKYKEFGVLPVSVNDFDQAQVTGGGILIEEVNNNLESIYNPGLYITGELLDVDGICGGYNLQWAFSTGILAGRDAACK